MEYYSCLLKSLSVHLIVLVSIVGPEIPGLHFVFTPVTNQNTRCVSLHVIDFNLLKCMKIWILHDNCMDLFKMLISDEKFKCNFSVERN